MLSRLPSQELADAQAIDGTVGLDEIREGDVVFCARPSFLQDLCTRAGEPWRHVGMATVHSGHASIVEVSGPRFGLRPLDEVYERSTTMAVARVEPEREPSAEKATGWCLCHIDKEQTYAWDDTILAGFIAVTRRFCLPEDRPWLEAVVARALVAADVRFPETEVDDGLGRRIAESYSCSAFVLAAFSHSACPLEFDLAQPRARGRRLSLWELVRGGDRPLRTANGDWISAAQASSVIKAFAAAIRAATGEPPISVDTSRWYRWATPGDIWRSPSFAERYVVCP